MSRKIVLKLENMQSSPFLALDGVLEDAPGREAHQWHALDSDALDPDAPDDCKLSMHFLTTFRPQLCFGPAGPPPPSSLRLSSQAYSYLCREMSRCTAQEQAGLSPLQVRHTLHNLFTAF